MVVVKYKNGLLRMFINEKPIRKERVPDFNVI